MAERVEAVLVAENKIRFLVTSSKVRTCTSIVVNDFSFFFHVSIVSAILVVRSEVLTFAAFP